MRGVERRGEHQERAGLMQKPQRDRRGGEDGPYPEHHLQADGNEHKPRARLVVALARREIEPYGAGREQIGADAMIELHRSHGFKRIVERRRSPEITVRKELPVHQRPGVEGAPRAQARHKGAEHHLCEDA